jgi:AAHS family 4-hydroxybenzoate transporter-like MFS transporter
MSGDLSTITLLLWLCCFMSVGVVFLLISYLPLMTEDMGMTASQGGVIVALLGWGGLLGQLSLSYAFKRFDRFRVVLALWSAGALALAVASLWAVHFAALLPAAFTFGFFLSASGSAVQVISADVYPPSARATGVSWASSMGKLGPVGFGLLGGLMVKVGLSLGTVFLVLVVPIGICILAGLRLRSRQRAVQGAPVPEPLPVTSSAAEKP